MLKKLFLCEDYLVSDEGYVLGKDGRKLRPSLNHNGYEVINVSIDGKTKGIAVHRAIMMSFCPEGKLDDTYQVNHIDGNKRNNHIDNLEWVTPRQNMRHSIDVLGNNRGALNGKSRSVVGVNIKDGSYVQFDSLIDAGAHFNTKNPRRGEQSIYRALRGFRKTAYGYVWHYNDAKLMEWQTYGT